MPRFGRCDLNAVGTGGIRPGGAMGELTEGVRAAGWWDSLCAGGRNLVRLAGLGAGSGPTPSQRSAFIKVNRGLWRS